MRMCLVAAAVRFSYPHVVESLVSGGKCELSVLPNWSLRSHACAVVLEM